MRDDIDVTALLLAWNDGDEAAHSRLVDVVYDELRCVARWHLRGEGAGHSLAPTALVHETYLKLVDQRRVRWQNRAHFFGVASRLMRRVLVDHARSRAAIKRGTDKTIDLDGVDVGTPPLDVDILALDATLDRLATVDARQCRLVEPSRLNSIVPTDRLGLRDTRNDVVPAGGKDVTNRAACAGRTQGPSSSAACSTQKHHRRQWRTCTTAVA